MWGKLCEQQASSPVKVISVYKNSEAFQELDKKF